MKKSLTVVLLSFIALIVSAQISFERTFSYRSLSSTSSINLPTADSVLPVEINIGLDPVEAFGGGYLTIGSVSGDNADYNSQLIRYDQYGAIVWHKNYGGEFNDFGRSLIKTINAEYVFTGSTASYGTGGFDVQLIKTDTSGNVIWSKTFGGAGNDYGNSVRMTSDGGFIITGSTNSFGAGSMDVYIIRTNNNGDLLWSSTFGGTSEDLGNAVSLCPDGGFIICGTTQSYGSGFGDAYLIKLNDAGNKEWSSVYGGTEEDKGVNVLSCDDGGFIISGTTFSYGAGSSDIYVVKTDLTGVVIWSKTYGGNLDEEGISVAVDSNGEYVISGTTSSFGSGNSDVCLIKTDVSGNVTWSKTFGAADNDGTYAVRQTADMCYLITGHTYGPTGKGDSYLIKTGLDGNTSCSSNDFFCNGSTVNIAGSFLTPANEFMSSNSMVTIWSLVPDCFNKISSSVLCANFPLELTTAPNTTTLTVLRPKSAPGPVLPIKAYQEAESGTRLRVFPNPGSGQFFFDGLEQNEKIQIYDSKGKQLVVNENGTLTKSVDLSDHAKGFYFYKIQLSSGELKTGTIILQ